jgi:hypothetical protein
VPFSELEYENLSFETSYSMWTIALLGLFQALSLTSGNLKPYSGLSFYNISVVIHYLQFKGLRPHFMYMCVIIVVIKIFSSIALQGAG